MIRTKSRMNALFAILLLSAVAIFWTACGGPRVESTSIDGSVRQIDNWEIEWTGDSTVTVDSTTLRWLTEKRSKYSQPEFCLEYIADVRQDLISGHSLPFYDNLPVSGKIEVSIEGTIKSVDLYTPTTDAERLTADLAKDRTGMKTDPFDREALYRSTIDLVRKVSVRLLDRDGKLLGEVFIGGNTEVKVKPHDVAEAIANAIKEGRAQQPHTPK